MSLDSDLIRNLLQSKGHSIREVSKHCNVAPSNLSQYLRGVKFGYIGKEKLISVAMFLGLDPSGDLLPGVHRWRSPGPDISDMQQLRSLIFRFFPGGGMVYPIFPRILFELDELCGGDEEKKEISVRVLLPSSRPDVRIILEVAPALRVPLSSKFSPENLGKGWIWPSGSVAVDPPRSDWKILETGGFNRLDPRGSPDSQPFGEESLTVPDMDAILGISGSLDWTWERLNAVLESKGITPEETARKMKIL